MTLDFRVRCKILKNFKCTVTTFGRKKIFEIKSIGDKEKELKKKELSPYLQSLIVQDVPIASFYSEWKKKMKLKLWKFLFQQNIQPTTHKFLPYAKASFLKVFPVLIKESVLQKNGSALL